MGEIWHRRHCWLVARSAGAVPRHRWFLYAWLLKLESGDSTGAGRSHRLGKMLQRFADALVVALAMVAAAEVLIEESPQRPQIFPAVLAAQKLRPSSVRFSLYRKNPVIKDFFWPNFREMYYAKSIN